MGRTSISERIFSAAVAVAVAVVVAARALLVVALLLAFSLKELLALLDILLEVRHVDET